MSDGAEVTFIGNEGVVVRTPGGTVAVDALFGHGAKDFTFAPDAVIDAVEAGRSPFDAIDAVLATHFHPDHFNPRSVGRHLRARTKTRFISTPQACALLDRKDPAFEEMSPRVASSRWGSWSMRVG
jgi:L-ascorbate metabolism protein UlaG (beta-lactamase superfamily)